MRGKQKETYTIKCPRCGYDDWQVMPSKWKRINNILKGNGKILHCPNCNKLVVLSQKETERILERC